MVGVDPIPESPKSRDHPSLHQSLQLVWKGKNQGSGRGLEFHQDQISTGGWPLRKHSRDSGKRPIPGQLLSTHTHAHIGVGMALGAAMRSAIASI